MSTSVIDQAIDTTTPAGRLLFHVLAAIVEFDRDLIRDRVVAGLLTDGYSIRRAARKLGVSPQAVHRATVRNARCAAS